MPLVLNEDWVGRRIVIRRAVAGGVFSDITGELLKLDGRRAQLSGPDGPVEIEVAEIARARLIAASTRDILALERAAVGAWRAAETAEVGGWLLRANLGFSARANSALALPAPAPDLATVLAAVRTWYRERDLPAKIAVPMPARAALDSALARLDWPLTSDIVVMVTSTSRLAERIAARAVAADVEITSRPDAQWLAVYERPERVSPAVVADLLTRHDRVGFAAIRHDGRTVAVARGTVDEGWLGLTAIAVEEAYRRQGLAQALIGALCRWAPDAGRTFLQTDQTNVAAIALYRSIGFWAHHTYRYRGDPSPGRDDRP
jgi:ribosomal protein S18 acetylase RimI-like enzyme